MKQIKRDEHVFICGMTGSGKSYLAEAYLTNYDYVIKLDTKDEASERLKKGKSAWTGLELGKDFEIVRNFEDIFDVESKKIIFVPDYDEQSEETFNRFFRFCFDRENTIIWVDELMSIGTVHRYPKELGRIYQQGRSKNVSIWACSQRPSGVPIIATANSTHFFVFQMGNFNDRKRMVDSTGMEQMLELPEKHAFWYYKMGETSCKQARLKVR